MAEEQEPDVVQVETALANHTVDATIFLPFLITRLRSLSNTGEATVTVLLRDVQTPGETRRDLRLRWSPDSEPRSALGVGEKVITELAACGVAAIVSSYYAGMRFIAVGGEGDAFDYWVGPNMTRDFGLEVSGMITEESSELEARHREKIRQLLGSVQRVNGYVVVVSFTMNRVILSFHRLPGGD